MDATRRPVPKATLVLIGLLYKLEPLLSRIEPSHPHSPDLIVCLPFPSR